MAGGHLYRRSPEPRHDEVLSVADRLHAALSDVERPRFLVQPPAPPHTDVDVFTAADRAAWEDTPLRSARAAGWPNPPPWTGRPASGAQNARQVA